MAVDDVITDVIKIGTGGSTTDFQPASGVEIIIGALNAESTSSTDLAIIQFYDGTDNTQIARGDAMGTDERGFPVYKLGITNGHYLRFVRSGSTDILQYGYSGIQTK